MNRIIQLSDTGYFDVNSENYSLIYNFIKDKCPIERTCIDYVKFSLNIKLSDVPIAILNAHDSVTITFYEDDYEPEQSDYAP